MVHPFNILEDPFKTIWYSKTDASIFKMNYSFFVWSSEDHFIQFVIELPSMVGGNFPPLPPRGLDFEGVSVLHGPVFRRGGKGFSVAG